MYSAFNNSAKNIDELLFQMIVFRKLSPNDREK